MTKYLKKSDLNKIPHSQKRVNPAFVMDMEIFNVGGTDPHERGGIRDRFDNLFV
jgi:hypothetical protein